MSEMWMLDSVITGGGVRRYVYVLMYADGKMRPVEIIPGMGRGGLKRMMEEVNSSIIYCKNFCKCHNVPPVQ
jgi:hypothetical protein